MKNCTAIICEYNPFHNGHKYQIKKAKENSNIILCIMSGNTVQRGGFAILDKYERAQIAICNGADIVIEHPFPFCMTSAADFASSGVYIANALNASFLAFGHESEKMNLLKIVDSLSKNECKEKINSIMKDDKKLSYPKAREKYFTEIFGDEIGSLLRKPNNILAVEYLLAMKKYKNIKPYFIERNTNFMSATSIREKITLGENISDYVPLVSKQYFDNKKCEIAILSYLNLCEEYKEIYDCDNSLYNRIIYFAKKVKSLDELVYKCTSSAYTSSKVRRAVYSIFFQTRKSDILALPSFSVLLGATKDGIDYLSENKKKLSIPILTRVCEGKAHNVDCERSFIADRLYSLFSDDDYIPFKKPYIQG